MNKYTIKEKDIEDCIFNEQLLKRFGIKCVARQVSSITVNGFKHDMDGIIDLIGYHARSKSWVIIELKRGVLDASAHLQLSRYMAGIKGVAQGYFCDRMGRKPRFFGLLIGSGVGKGLEFMDDINDLEFYDKGCDWFNDAILTGVMEFNSIININL